MKRLLRMLALISALPVLLSAATKAEHFPLQLHVVRVDMAQGQTGVSGSGSADGNGNYSSRVSGGGSYLYRVYIVHIDGDARELTLTTPRQHFGKGGMALTIATAGGGAPFAAHRNDVLHLSDYKARWNKDGSLEIEIMNEKGKLKQQQFFVQAESQLTAQQR